MAIFWEWAVRNPFALLGFLALCAGASQLIGWGIALCALTLCYMVSRVGNGLMARAQRQERERAELARAHQQALKFVPDATHHDPARAA